MINQQKNAFAVKSVIWLIISAFLLVTVLPAHFHVHHDFDVDPSVHEHSVDLHLVADKPVDDHHEEDVDIFAATPDGTVKKKSSSVLYFLLVSFVIAFLLNPRLLKVRWGYLNFKLQQRFYLDSPPLRAPPLH